MVEHDGTDVATLSEFIDDNTFRVLCSTKSWVDLLAVVSKADCDGAADRDDNAAGRAVVGGGGVDAANLDGDASHSSSNEPRSHAYPPPQSQHI